MEAELSSLGAQLNSLQSAFTQLQEGASSYLTKNSEFPGPGAYDASYQFPESQRGSSLKFSFSKANLDKSTGRSLSPSPLQYTPKFNLTSLSPRAAGIGVDHKPRLHYIEELSKRSPGAIYDIKTPVARSSKFGTSKRSIDIKNEAPSPGEYSLDKCYLYLRKGLGGKFLQSYRNRYNGDSQTPGMIYNPKYPSRASPSPILRRTGHVLSVFDTGAPPVGRYTPVMPKSGKTIMFSKARRF